MQRQRTPNWVIAAFSATLQRTRTCLRKTASPGTEAGSGRATARSHRPATTTAGRREHDGTTPSSPRRDGLTMAGMFAPNWSFGPSVGWELVFSVFLVWFAARSVQSILARGSICRCGRPRAGGLGASGASLSPQQQDLEGQAPTWNDGTMRVPPKSYTAYSVGCGVVWAVIMGVLAAGRDKEGLRRVLPVFGGWWMGWTSATIARWVYPPPTSRPPSEREP